MGVVWLSHLEMGKEGLRTSLSQAIMPAEARPAIYPVPPSACPVSSMRLVWRCSSLGSRCGPMRCLILHAGSGSAQLAVRLERGLGVRLPDACAGSNGTFASVPRLLTLVDVVDEVGAARKPTLLAIAKAAGASTAYINNHEIWVVPEEGHDFSQKISSMDVNTYDEVAIEAMADFLKRTDAASKAVLIHLLWSALLL